MADRYWVGGTASWDATAGSKWATTSGGAGGSAVPTSADDVYIDSGSGAVTVTVGASSVCRDLRFVSGAGSFAGTFAGSSAIAMHGSFVASASMTWTATGTITAAATTAQTITTNGKALTCPVTFDGVSGSWALQDALTTGSTRNVVLTNGGLDLNGFNVTSGTFSSSNSNVRSITSGAGQFYCSTSGSSGSTVPWTVATITNLTLVDRPTVNLTGNGSGTAIRGVQCGAVGEAVAPNVNVLAGTDTINNIASNVFGSFDFTGFSGTWANLTRTLYGSLTLSATMTAAAGTNNTSFRATSGTQVITSNGVTLDFTTNVNAPGATVQLADALTLGSTRVLNLTDGSFNAAGFNVTTGTVTAGASFDTLTMGAGTWTIQGSGASAWSINAAVTVVPGTSTVSMTSASAKTFVGAGKTYYNLTQGGAGALTVTGANTFNDITNTTQPVSILFTAGTTTTVSALSLAGTAGNLVTIGSVTAASHTLSKASGTVIVRYCTISRSTATGGANWLAPTSGGNVDGANNSGWSFAAIAAEDEGLPGGGISPEQARAVIRKIQRGRAEKARRAEEIRDAVNEAVRSEAGPSEAIEPLVKIIERDIGRPILFPVLGDLQAALDQLAYIDQQVAALNIRRMDDAVAVLLLTEW